MNNMQKSASELLRIAKDLVSSDVPEWVEGEFVKGIDIAGTILKKFNAQYQGVNTWALVGKSKIYKDRYGWISVSWDIMPVREGTEWKLKSTLSFAPATSGSFANRKFAEFKNSGMISGNDAATMFNVYGKSISVRPDDANVSREVASLISRHGSDFSKAKKYWKDQVKNFDLEGGR